MCLILLAHGVHARYSLVVAANRDEFYARPTAPLHIWQDAPDIAAGRDLQGGGTWLGVDKKGRLAAITNYREPGSHRPDAPSRGHLVSDFLAEPQDARSYLEQVARRAAAYNGFTLIAADRSGLFVTSNRGGGVQRLVAGVHGLCNHLPNTPWPKVVAGKRRLSALLTGEHLDADALFALLADGTPFPDDQLPDTGIGLTSERLLSSLFVCSPGYGTRSSSVILGDRQGRITFCERTFNVTADRPACTAEQRLVIQTTVPS